MSKPQKRSIAELLDQLSINTSTLNDESTDCTIPHNFDLCQSSYQSLNYRDWKESFINESLNKKIWPKLSNNLCMALIDNWLLSLVTGFGGFDFVKINMILCMQLRDPLDLSKFVFDSYFVDEIEENEEKLLNECKDRFDVSLIEEYKVKLAEKSHIHLENGNIKHGTMKDFMDKFCDNWVNNVKAMIFYRWLKQSSRDDNAKIALCAFIALCTNRVGVNHVSNMQFLVREKFHLDFRKFYGIVFNNNKPTGFPNPNQRALEQLKNHTEKWQVQSILAQTLYICEHDKVVHLRPLLRFAILNVYDFTGLPVIKNYLRACELTGLKGEQFIDRYINQSYMKDEFIMILRKYEQMKAQDGMWALNWSRALLPECMFAYSKRSDKLCQLLCDIINSVGGFSVTNKP